MNNLTINSEYYNLPIDNVNFEGDLFIEENLITNFNVDKNRAMYILVQNQDIKFIESLLEKLNEKSIIFYIYEDYTDLYRIFSYFENEQISGKFEFFKINLGSEHEGESLQKKLHSLIYLYTNIYPLIVNKEDFEYLKKVRILMQTIREIKDNYAFLLGNDVDDTLYGLENRFINFEHYANHIGLNEFLEHIKDAYKDKPAIIVSSGPSLDKNVHLLKAYEDKALILSCDGSYTTLKNNGIKSHFIGSVERIVATYKAFYEGREFPKDLILLAPAVVRSEIVNKFNGNSISLFKEREPFGELLNKMTSGKKGTLYCGSSVAHLLFSFANKVGCNPIILIGQDLSYDIEGYSHAGDSEVKTNKSLENVDVWLKGNYEDEVPSTYIWEKFLITYVELIKDARATVINATEGGAFIEGTKIQVLREALEENCKEHIKKPSEFYKEISTFSKYSDFEEISKAVILNFFDEYYKLYNDLLLADKGNKKAMKNFQKGIKTNKELNRIYDSLDNTDKIVNEITQNANMMFLFQYAIRNAIHQINQLGQSEYTLENIKINLEIHSNLLSEIIFNTKRMLRMLALTWKDELQNLESFKNIDWLEDKKYDFIRN